jgi:uncharacterized paraquat-inducible protein A
VTAAALLLAAVCSGLGFYAGWRMRSLHESDHPHREVELAGCPKCRTIYVSTTHTRCPECGQPLHRQHVIAGECVSAK